MTATGCREVPTLEGAVDGAADFLQPFRGVSKKYLRQCVAILESGYNVKRATPGFLRALLGVKVAIDISVPTFCPS